MALRGVKPKEVKPRLKALFYGAAGVGKTMAAISFPQVYLIDTEQGAIHKQYTDKIEEINGAVFQTTDFDELMTEVKALLTTEHPYKTLVIDPLTILYDDLLDKSAVEVGTEFGRHYGIANKKIKHLLTLLSRLDMNVIITSHAKKEYGKDLSVLGSTFDCYKKLDHLFDLVFQIEKRGKERVGIVKKSRIEAFPDGDVFPFSYDIIAERYGKDILEKDAVVEVLASPEQVAEIKDLINAYKVDSTLVQKWLDKAKSETFEEMKGENIQKCIDYINSKFKGEAP